MGGENQNIKVASEFKIMDIQMEINPNVKELHNYLKKNGVVIRNDAPGEFGADTLTRLIEYMEKLREEALTSDRRPYHAQQH